MNDADNSQLTMRRRWPLVFVLVVGLGASIFAAQQQRSENHETTRKAFSGTVRQFVQLRKEAFRQQLIVLNSVNALLSSRLVDASASSAARELLDYLSLRDIDREFSGVYGIGLIERVAPANEANFTAQMQLIHGQSFAIRSLQQNPTYTGDKWVVSASYPDRNKAAVGIDITSEKTRLTPIGEMLQGYSHNNSGINATKAIDLVQIDGDRVSGFLIYRAIGNVGADMQRIAYLVVNFEHIGRSLLQPYLDRGINNPFELFIFDDATDSCLFSFTQSEGMASSCPDDFQRNQSPYEISDLHTMQNFYSIMRPTNEFVNSLGLTSPWSVLLYGLTATLAILAGTLVLYRQRTLLAQMVEDRTKELTLKTRESLMAERAKDEFLTKMSHELRTPLNGIFGAIQMFQLRKIDPEWTQALNVADRSARHLLAIVDEMTELDLIRQRRIHLNLSSFNIRSSLEMVRALLTDKARLKNIVLSVQVDEAVPEKVIGDQRRLQQILINLLENGISFSSQGQVNCEVSVLNLESSRVTLQFNITDTGQGMSKEQQRQVHALADERRFDLQNTSLLPGLGLRIVNELLHLMGGKLALTSTLGIGTQVKFALGFALDTSSADTPMKYLPPLPEQQKVFVLSKDNAIVIDDGVLGGSVSYFQDLAELQQAIALPTPLRAVVIDIDSDIDALLALAGSASSYQLIACVSDDNKMMRIKAYAQGVTDILLKPLESDALLSMLQSSYNDD